MTERSLDVWFAHGTVVLRAANVLYRVYAGTLASKASVFADMFQVMGVAGSERIEGCPVVDLHDAPDELSPFLKSLHDARYYAKRTKELRVVLSVLRLATKYDAPYFRDHAFGVLSAQFPTTWDARQRSYVADPSLLLTRNYVAVHLVNLSLELPLQQMLPSALLLLSTGAPLVDILDGTPMEDGSRVELSWPMKSLCLLGRGKIFSAVREHIYPLFERFSAGIIKTECLRNGTCKTSVSALIHGLDANTDMEAQNILKPARITSWIKWSFDGRRPIFCNRCCDCLEPLYNQQCALIWEKLPSYFDLPAWEELSQTS